jgi:signal transduction histidine kinase
MNDSLPDFLALLSRARATMDTAVAENPDAARRAAAVCSALHGLWPASVVGCVLGAGPDPHAAAVDEQGTPRPEWAETLRDQLARDGSPGQAAGVGRPGQHLLVVPVAVRDRRYGALALAPLPAGTADEGREALARELLAVCADRLAWHLLADEGSAAGAVAELTSLVCHDFNNYLNAMLLQVSLLEQQLAGRALPELKVVRRVGNQAATLVKRMQHFNRQDRPALDALDLTEVVRQTLAELRERHPTVRFEPAPGLPRVLGTVPVLRRLLLTLLGQAAAAAGSAGGVTVRTESAGRRVALRVEDSGPPIPADSLAQVFEPFAVSRGGDGTALAVAKALARRLQGGIQAVNRPEGGVEVVVELGVAPGGQ